MIYHRLDPFWRRFPFPRRVEVEARSHGPVTELCLTPLLFAARTLSVRCFRVGDTLIDCGFAPAREAVLAASRGALRAIVTHHHEDHAGNAAALLAAGIRVEAPATTAELLAGRLPLLFYQHLVWGAMEPCAGIVPLGAETEIDGRRAVVVPAPGHAPDMVALHVPAEGWLFSGDAFIGERVRLFRRDEDFATTLETLRRLLALDFDALFCAHAPRPTGGKAALAAKLADLEALAGKVRDLHAQGLPPRQIARRLTRRRPMELLTFGDATSENLVRAVLGRRWLRPEVAAVVQPRWGRSGS